jgi:hypothetical protein
MLPRIAMISQHGCIRVFKESWALKQAGYEVHLVANQDAFGWNMYDSFMKYVDDAGLQKAVRLLETAGVDIFHVHNEPNSLATVTRDATTRPIVFDVHDLDALRWKDEPDSPYKDEVDAFEAADGFVHVSYPCRDHAEKIFGNSKPTRVLHSFVNERFLLQPDDLRGSGYASIVYEGGLSTNNNVQIMEDIKGTEKQRVTFNMRFYGPMVESFINQGFAVGLMSALDLPDNYYENLGAFVTTGLPYPTMLAGLRPYGFGFVGACISAPLMEAALPNKLFEYLSQGLVPVCLFCDEAEKFVEKYQCGVVIEDFDNLQEKLSPTVWATERQQVLKLLPEFTMESHIGAIKDLYEEVM